MRTPPPSRRLVSASAPATLLLLPLLLAGAADAAPPLVGVSPQDEAYFAPQVIACRDGTGYFPRSRLNDGFCDCPDGTDEPGTSACPEGKFYCRNTGDAPRFLFSSFVNDKICDCCDGSDEYESGIHCPNTCRNINSIAEAKHTLDIDDLFQKLRGLRTAVFIELGLVVFIFAFCFARRRTRARRRHYILKPC
ncbi:hypothetical protein ACP70R_036781 [Stipagrostis hirtigluma subsp. patula]